MEIEQAEHAGATAFSQGLGSAPAFHPTFTSDACAGTAGDIKKLSKLLSAYSYGWTVASLANGVDDPQMPSVIQLARIMRSAA